MHSQTIENFRHEHVYLGPSHARNEARTWAVVALTTAAMVAEIAAGALFGSMALLADGWHMATHAAALSIAALAYRFARRHARDPRFSFGTGKLGELAGFASAIILGLVALAIGFESAMRLFAPVAIDFGDAILVAVLGLIVNLGSAWLLAEGGHHHGDEHHHAGNHAHPHAHHHPPTADANLRAAYLHVLADALTSVLAIVALVAGRYLGWIWLDPAIGIVGALVIARWSWGLVRSAGAVLLDTVPSPHLAAAIRERLEAEGDRVADLHFWRLGPGHAGLIAAIVAEHPQPPETYKARLAGFAALSHVTIEVHACPAHARQS